MGHSQADKARSHERILAEAAAQIRSGGLDSVSVATLMKSVGLTHGGFYGHFDSRSALISQALEQALADGEAMARAAGNGQPRSFATIVRNYLSRSHRDAPQTGCAIAALAGDVGRADEATRDVMAGHVEQSIQAIAASLDSPDETQAMAAISTLVGALALSRVLTDPKRSDALLRAARDHLLASAASQAAATSDIPAPDAAPPGSRCDPR